MYISEEDYLAHYGILRRSGRYPWGSGKDENTRNKMFLDYVSELKSQGLTEVEIARGLGISTTELRASKSIARTQQRQANIAMAQRLKDKGYSVAAISRRMDLPHSTVRSLLEPGVKDKADVLQSTANMLREQVGEKTFVDVGRGSESYIGISNTKLDTAVAILRNEGYELHYLDIPQLGTGKETRFKILCPPGTTWGDVQKNRFQIQQVNSWSDDGGRTYAKLHEPLSVNPKRLGVLYKEDGGAQADGMIYVRPGVSDVSLGGSKYAQVRIKVGDSHYLKGMAMYKDDLPDGVDLLFNTNKTNTGNKLDALKPISEDPDLPFSSIVRQIIADPGTSKERVTSAVNIVSGNVAAERGNEEGTWETWSRTLSSQMLSKQSIALAKSQLDMTYENREQQFDDIMALTNSTVRKKLLQEFSDGTDAAAVHLQAAAMPGQAVRVILPLSHLAPTQVYAPGFRNGDRVVLIRHPHGGTFEIPELVVNNRNAEGTKLLGDVQDAIGIHHTVAQRLSGADFDGDTVLVIPNNRGDIKTTPALDGVKDFDPVASYPKFPGMPVMKKSQTQTEMGKISNLITDMTLRGAPPEDIARAIKHSMVVIDAEKKELNYKLSYNDNGIKELKEQYQRKPTGSRGASTLISRARSREDVPQRTLRKQSLGGPIDPVTGAKVYTPTGQISKLTGKPRMERSQKLAEVSDAHLLSSGTRMEVVYANHSNKLKGLANTARLEILKTPRGDWSQSAKKTYASEVQSLNDKLDVALKNAPLERQAQLIANSVVKAKRDYNPDLDDDTLQKIKYKALEEARARTGAGKQRIHITNEEWDAIQAGAISDSKLTQILNNADMDRVRDLATPKPELLMTPAKTNRAATMLASGYSRAEVAAALGVSVSTLDLATSGEEG